MQPNQWYIKAARACTGQGSTPTQIYAGVQTLGSNIQLNPAITVEFEGVNTPSLTCPMNEQGLTPSLNRCAKLAAYALTELDTELPETAALALQIGTTQNQDSFLETLADELAELGQFHLVHWVETIEIIAIQKPEDWQQLKPFDQVIWLNADHLINTKFIQSLSHRIANEIYPEGIVAGEAASVLWLSKNAANSDCPVLTVHLSAVTQLSQTEEWIPDCEPSQCLLINSVSSEPKQQSAWFQWVSKYETDIPYKEAPQLWLARSFGYLGAASAGIGVLCALGYLNLPVATTSTALVVDLQLASQYHFYQIEQGKHHVR
ncbi:MAG: hypothetical protein P8X74_21000 [Reinekea sp.]